jgi:hypothetical protein
MRAIIVVNSLDGNFWARTKLGDVVSRINLIDIAEVQKCAALFCCSISRLIFHATVRENITYARPSTNDEIADVARVASIHGFLRCLMATTPSSPNAAKLSGRLPKSCFAWPRGAQLF